MTLLFSVSLLVTSAVAKSSYPLLPTTPKHACDTLLLGERHGVPHKGLGFWLLRKLVGARYRVEIKGLDDVLHGGSGGIALLPQHQGLSDPIVNVAKLGPALAPRPVMTESMTRGPFGFAIRWLLAQISGILLPVTSEGETARGLSTAVLAEVGNALKNGDNILIYPSGGIQLAAEERVGSKSAIETLLKLAPDVRLVGVRERGLWGSSWGHGGPASRPDHQRTTGQVLTNGLLTAARTLILNGFLLTPKRPVTLELVEFKDFPRAGTREEQNAYLEAFYNNPPEHRTFVRRYAWQFWRKKIEVSEEKIDYGSSSKAEGSAITIDPKDLDPETTKQLISIVGGIMKSPDVRLATEIDQLDSLDSVTLLTELQEKFNINLADDTKLTTVAELSRQIKALREEPAPETGLTATVKASSAWRNNPSGDSVVTHEEGQTLTEMVVRRALKEPTKVIAEDKTAGSYTYRKLLVTSLALSTELEKLAGQNLGVLMPASSAGPLIYLASHLAGKTPVYINFTGAAEEIPTLLKDAGVERIITSRAVVKRLAKAYNLAPYMDRFVYVDDLKLRIMTGLPSAVLTIRLKPDQVLARTRRTENAVILFTSGSSGKPKTVPLSHANIIANVTDLTRAFNVKESDRLLITLPPFHSFGHLVQGLSLVLGLPAVYHAKPTDARIVDDLIGSYKPTIVLGVPTILEDYAKKARGDQLASVRLAVAGAQKVTKGQARLIEDRFSRAELLEGYGATELSPVVAVELPGQGKSGTVGPALPSVQIRLVDPETLAPVDPGEVGLMLVAGPSVFGGYRSFDGEQPFKTIDGVEYYNTKDLFREDSNHRFIFNGRAGRVYKRAGEKVGMDHLAEVLEPLAEKYRGSQEGPLIAVQAYEDEQPLVLFTSVDIPWNEVQATLRENGIRGASNIDELRKLDAIPRLGIGKIDFAQLKQMLKPAH